VGSDWQPQFVPPPAAFPAPTPRATRISSLPALAMLMIVHGALVGFWALFCLFAIAVGIVNVGFLGARRTEDWIVISLYTVFGAAAFAVSALNIVSGIQLRKLRAKKLAFGALIAGAASFVCGNVFCLPLALGVMIFGIIVLTDRGVSEAFARVEAGEPAERVLGDLR
jgi:hypothetical protein